MIGFSFALWPLTVGLLGGARGRCGLGAGATTHQLHLIPHGELATLDDKTVERELALEAPIDVAGDVLVPDQRVRIVCRHDAARTQILDTYEPLSYAQAVSRPISLRQPVDAADHDVWSQAAMVVTEGGHGAVDRHQILQHVEALNAIVAH